MSLRFLLRAFTCFVVGGTVVEATDLDSVLPNGNTADGSGVLISLTSAVWNTGLGFEALNHDTTGGSNTAEGVRALFSNTTGSSNTALGVYALSSNTSGGQNTASGQNALRSNTTGTSNTATGFETLFKNNGHFNTASGYHTLYANTGGNFNTADGHQALASNTTGTGNTASGVNALVFNTVGSHNSAYGDSALYSNTVGDGNTATGFRALYNCTGGYFNTAVGWEAGFYGTGSGNIYLGSDSSEGVADENNVMRLGRVNQWPTGATYIHGIFGKTVSGGVAVYIKSNGQLGTMTSSGRFKHEIKDMADASDVLLSLRPVSFRYKSELDPKQMPQWGLVAEEVEKVQPDLVVRDRDGTPYTVRYDAINAMLLNEFLKEHRQVQKLEATVADQQKEFQAKIAQQHKQIEALTVGLQRVSHELQLRKAAPSVVSNP